MLNGIPQKIQMLESQFVENHFKSHFVCFEIDKKHKMMVYATFIRKSGVLGGLLFQLSCKLELQEDSVDLQDAGI